jgi:RNA polymerase sigma-70 factor, ECF subfamily
LIRTPRPSQSTAPQLRVVQGGASPNSEDLALAALVARGDRQAAAVVYDRHVGRVDGTLYRVLGRREVDHDDLVQTAFIQIVTSLGRYAGECSLATWVTKISAHVAYNALRSRKRARAVFSGEAPSEGESEGVACDPMVALRLRAALAQLTEEKAETIVLHDMLGHDLAEVASLMGVTVAAAQSRLVRARRELRGLLDEGESAPGGEP